MTTFSHKYIYCKFATTVKFFRTIYSIHTLKTIQSIRKNMKTTVFSLWQLLRYAILYLKEFERKNINQNKASINLAFKYYKYFAKVIRFDFVSMLEHPASLANCWLMMYKYVTYCNITSRVFVFKYQQNK